MDLFGDLPAAKNSSSGGGNNHGGDDLFGGLPAAVSSASAAVAGDETTGGEPKSADAAETKITSAAGETSSVLSSGKRKSAPSLVSFVGKAGTSLAFVPQAIAQARKRKKVSSHESKNKIINILISGADDEKQTKESIAILNNGEALSSQKAPTTSNEVIEKSAIIDVKSTTVQHASQQEQNDDVNVDTKEEQQYEEPYLENEPESIRLLHASVTPENAYNPHYPNDYLAQKTERIQKELQQSALQRLDQQEKLRKKIEEERRKIESSGDVNKIVESRMMMGGSDSTSSAGGVGGGGRGRGRRVQNLPAWLVKKQQEEEQQKRA
jgi:hypothetical protein